MILTQLFNFFRPIVEVATAPPQATIILRFINSPFYCYRGIYSSESKTYFVKYSFN